MGCGSSQKISIPIISVPKWNDDITIIEPQKKQELNYYLITNKKLIKISNDAISYISHQVPIHESGTVSLSKSVFFIAGGFNRLTSKDTSDCYIISDSDIKKVLSLPYPTRRMRLLFYNDYIYCIGGVRETNVQEISLDYSKNFFRYQNDVWEILSDMPIGVEYPGCFGYNSNIYVIGGCYVNELNLEVIDTVQVYSINKSQWSILKFSMPVAVYGQIAVPKDSSNFLLIGGIDCNGENSSMAYIVGLNDSEEIASIPMGTSTFFPYCFDYDGGVVYASNDRNDLLCLNRLKRKWNILNQDYLDDPINLNDKI
jgi:Kelch motif